MLSWLVALAIAYTCGWSQSRGGSGHFPLAFMARSIKVHPKKRMGRPATGKNPLLSARVPKELIDRVEKWAKLHAISRSEAVRRLIERGLPHARPASKVDIPSVY